MDTVEPNTPKAGPVVEPFAPKTPTPAGEFVPPETPAVAPVVAVEDPLTPTPEGDSVTPYTPVVGPVAEVAMPSTAVAEEEDAELDNVPINDWLPVNVLAAFSCAYRLFVAAVFRLSVTLPLVPPPVRSVPAVTPVIVPVPGDAQAHALPVHCRI